MENESSPAYDTKSSSGGGKSAKRVNAYNLKYDARNAMGDWSNEAWYKVGFDDNL